MNTVLITAVCDNFSTPVNLSVAEWIEFAGKSHGQICNQRMVAVDPSMVAELEFTQDEVSGQIAVSSVDVNQE
jgi:hypothetical protein